MGSISKAVTGGCVCAACKCGVATYENPAASGGSGIGLIMASEDSPAGGILGVWIVSSKIGKVASGIPAAEDGSSVKGVFLFSAVYKRHIGSFSTSTSSAVQGKTVREYNDVVNHGDVAHLVVFQFAFQHVVARLLISAAPPISE